MKPLLPRHKVRPLTRRRASNSRLVLLMHHTTARERQLCRSKALLRSFDRSLMQEDLVERIQLWCVWETTDLSASREGGLQLAHGRVDQRLWPETVNDNKPFLCPLLDLRTGQHWLGTIGVHWQRRLWCCPLRRPACHVRSNEIHTMSFRWQRPATSLTNEQASQRQHSPMLRFVLAHL